MAFRSRSLGWIGIEARTTPGSLHLMESVTGGASWEGIRIAVPKKYDSLYFTPTLVRFFNGGQEGILIGSGIGMFSSSVTLPPLYPECEAEQMDIAFGFTLNTPKTRMAIRGTSRRVKMGRCRI